MQPLRKDRLNSKTTKTNNLNLHERIEIGSTDAIHILIVVASNSRVHVSIRKACAFELLEIDKFPNPMEKSIGSH